MSLLAAFHNCFGGRDEELHHVDFDLARHGTELVRKTMIRRAGVVEQESEMTAIRRV